MKTLKLLFVIIISLSLVVLSFLLHNTLIELLIIQLKGVIVLTNRVGYSGGPLMLAGAVLTIALIYLILNYFVQFRNLFQVFVLYLTTLLFGILFTWLRIKYLSSLVEGFKYAVRHSKFHCVR